MPLPDEVMFGIKNKVTEKEAKCRFGGEGRIKDLEEKREEIEKLDEGFSLDQLNSRDEKLIINLVVKHGVKAVLDAVVSGINSSIYKNLDDNELHKELFSIKKKINNILK